MFSVNRQKCIKCWGCIPICPVDAIAQGKNSAVINPNTCTLCGLCEKVCPVGAISNSDHFDENRFAKIESSSERSHPDKVMQFDVVIIGGGPGGLSAAYFAANAGLSVCLIERRKKFGIPVACAEGISTEGLTKVFEPQKNWISTTIEGALIVSPAGIEIFVDHPAAGFVLDRPAMESDIAEFASSKGAEIFINTRAVEIIGEESAEKILIERDGNFFELRGKYFIGADGIGGISNRWAFPNRKTSLTDIETCAQVLLQSDEVVDKIPEFYWGHKIAPGGYAWVFPKGENLANVGLGIVPAMTKISPQTFLKKFLSSRFSHYKIIERRDGVVPTTMRYKPLGRENLLLVGDAGKMTNSISGSGIDVALLSGKIAAETIAEFFNSGYKKVILEYDRRWHRALGKQLDLYARLRRGILKLRDDEFDEIAVLLRKQLSKRKWTALNIPKIVKDIVFSQPKLLKIARHFL